MGRMWILAMFVLPAGWAAAAPQAWLVHAATRGGVLRIPAGLTKGYRMLVPAGLKPGEKRPLVVWLHPEGAATVQEFADDFWPRLKRHNVFLMMPEPRRPAGSSRTGRS